MVAGSFCDDRKSALTLSSQAFPVLRLGVGLTGLNIRELCNLLKHHLIEVKFGTANYQYMIFQSTKFECSSFLNLGEIALQTYPFYEGKVINLAIPLRKMGLT